MAAGAWKKGYREISIPVDRISGDQHTGYWNKLLEISDVLDS